MYIPTNIAEELKRYLKQQANKGDLEAQTLLAQIEQAASSPSLVGQQAMDVPAFDGMDLGC